VLLTLGPAPSVVNNGKLLVFANRVGVSASKGAHAFVIRTAAGPGHRRLV
jgi:hypothetical protein